MNHAIPKRVEPCVVRKLMGKECPTTWRVQRIYAGRYVDPPSEPARGDRASELLMFEEAHWTNQPSAALELFKVVKELSRR